MNRENCFPWSPYGQAIRRSPLHMKRLSFTILSSLSASIRVHLRLNSLRLPWSDETALNRWPLSPSTEFSLVDVPILKNIDLSPRRRRFPQASSG